MYEQGPPRYTVAMFEDLGKAIGISLLDSINRNPHSRMRTLEMDFPAMRIEAAMDLVKKAPYRMEHAL
jgi:hypothetical protein